MSRAMTRRRNPPPGADSWSHVTARLRESAHLREELPTERANVQHAVLELVGRVQGRRVLDIGVGSSAIARSLAQQGAEVVVTPDLLEPAVTVRGPFDVITAAHCLDDSPDPEALLRVAAKLLHPRGRIVLALEHPWREAHEGAAPHAVLASLPALLAALRTAGLRLVEAAEPKPGGTVAGERPALRHIVLLAERVGRRTRNRGTRR
jgi:SAM-dependent methyltransferase